MAERAVEAASPKLDDEAAGLDASADESETVEVDEGNSADADDKCCFNLAFRTLRIDRVRQETRLANKAARLPEGDGPSDAEPDEDAFAKVSEAFRTPATQVLGDRMAGAGCPAPIASFERVAQEELNLKHTPHKKI